MNHWDIIHPRRRFVALPLYDDSNLLSLSLQTVTFRKRPFPSAVLINGVLSLWIPSMSLTRPAIIGWLSRCKDKNFL